MAKRTTRFTCQNCGSVTSRWAGRCDGCGEWNTIVEEIDGGAGGVGGAPAGLSASAKRGRVVPLVALCGEAKEAPRIVSGIAELDRVTKKPGTRTQGQGTSFASDVPSDLGSEFHHVIRE